MKAKLTWEGNLMGREERGREKEGWKKRGRDLDLPPQRNSRKSECEKTDLAS